MIKNENFITIQGWMINELGLKGNALIVYATIYGFSQTEDCEFTGSAKYLADWCGCSRQTIINILNNLVKQNYIIKREEIRNNVKFCTYKANFTGCQKIIQGDVKKFDKGVSKNCTEGCKKILHNNIDSTINKKIEDNIDKKISKKADTSKIIIDTCLKNDIEDDASIEIIEQFLMDNRIKIKGAIEANIAKIAGKSYNIIERCIDLAYARNYKYIPDPSWLDNNNSTVSKGLRLEDSTTTEAGREQFREMVRNNDPRLQHF